MRKKLYRLIPILATVIQFVLSAVIVFVHESICPPKQPGPTFPIVFHLIFFGTIGLIEITIGYFVQNLYEIRKSYKVLLIYGIIYCTLNICWGLLISDSRYRNDVMYSIIIFMVPTILYLVPYIYGTIKFTEQIKTDSKNQ